MLLNGAERDSTSPESPAGSPSQAGPHTACPAPCRAQVSPDGGLLQSSTVADRVSFTFAGGETELVPGAYIEFAERLVLPQFAGLQVGWYAYRGGWVTRSSRVRCGVFA